MNKTFYKIKEEYEYIQREFSDYIEYFGSLKDIIYTPYFHLAIFFSTVSVFLSENPSEWLRYAIEVVPSLLGFSLGGYAILISFGDQDFRKYLATKKVNGNNNSIFLILNGTFLHFIIMQVSALTISTLFLVLDIKKPILNFMGCTFFYYTLIFCVAVAFEIKTLSKWYKKFICSRKNLKDGNNPNKVD